jgi:hypothetical protein
MLIEIGSVGSTTISTNNLVHENFPLLPSSGGKFSQIPFCSVQAGILNDCLPFSPVESAGHLLVFNLKDSGSQQILAGGIVNL